MIAISKPNPIDGDHQRVAFDIRCGTQRISCSLNTNFQTKELAKRYLHANRPLIEQMARNQVEQRGALNGEVNLEIA